MDSLNSLPAGTRGDSCATFDVHEVEVGALSLGNCAPQEFIERALAAEMDVQEGRMFPIEACSHPEEAVIALPAANGLLGAVHVAFSQHLPLSLSPDMIWLAIAQGFALHVKHHAEELRSQFVPHEGKAEIVLERRDFIAGSPDNPWPEVFDTFAGVVRRVVGPMCDTLVADFTTTGPVERAASQVVMLGVFEPYFQYVMRCICGIPQITLEGTVTDWERVRTKTESLVGYGCDWWIEALRPVCDQFVQAASGNVDRAFWQRIYKLTEVYGGEVVEGWIAHLFPYVKDRETGSFDRRNPVLEGGMISITSGDIPCGLTQVPFFLEDERGGRTAMHFLAGFTGATYTEESKLVRPKIGWAVAGNPRIEKLLARLREEGRKPGGHVVWPPRRDFDRVIEREYGVERHPIWSLDPALRRFYETCDGTVLFGGAYEINSLRTLVESHGPGGWQNLGRLADGSHLIIGHGVMRYNDAEGPGCGVVIASSFEGFLERALASNGALYMDEPDFEPGTLPYWFDPKLAFEGWSDAGSSPEQWEW